MSEWKLPRWASYAKWVNIADFKISKEEKATCLQWLIKIHKACNMPVSAICEEKSLDRLSETLKLKYLLDRYNIKSISSGCNEQKLERWDQTCDFETFHKILYSSSNSQFDTLAIDMILKVNEVDIDVSVKGISVLL